MFSVLLSPMQDKSSLTEADRDEFTIRVVEQCSSLLPDHVRKVQSFWEGEGAEDLCCLLGKTTPISSCRFCIQRLNRERQIWRGIPASTCICETEKWSGQMWCKTIYSTWHQKVHCYVCSSVFMPVHGHLRNPCQLSAELGQNRVLLGLNISVKLGLDLPCRRVQQNSRKLNCTDRREEGGTCYQ